MTKAEKEKLRYRAVRNAYDDVELARKARKWSDQEILNRIGVKVPTRTPKLKPISSKRSQKAKLRILKNFQYAKNQGLKTEEALKVRWNVRRKIDSYVVYKKEQKIKITKQNKEFVKSRRIDQWKEWAKSDALPSQLKKYAETLNRSNPYLASSREGDDTDKFGYATTFYMYVENMSYEEVQQKIIKDTSRWDGNQINYLIEKRV
jgi:hypothetical protein